ncbi:GIY-YIG nuclease family protein [Candidatus Omnitrophota bacterium]
MDIKKKIKTFPDKPGVYSMKDNTGTIIYIGKAISLRKRVASYFRKASPQHSKQEVLISHIHDIEYIRTETEAQALLLEAELIKKHKPKYNVDLRDDKSFPVITITRETFPSVFIARPKKKGSGRYFGPYTNVSALRGILKIIRDIFPFRSCRKLPKRACLYHSIKLCPAPCIEGISKTAYRRNIKNIMLILEGKYERLLVKLTSRMQQLAKQKRFEEAAAVRDQMMALGSLYSGGAITTTIGELQQLKDVLRLPTLPLRIEAFDISNIYGKEAVGSMVSFLQGRPDKKNYRRFRIREVTGIDDYQMLAEVIRRRYARLQKERLRFPHLIVVDGGKGQLQAARNTLEVLEVSVPVVSIAKEHEEIFIPNRKQSIRLVDNAPALRLVRRIRDEAHRFALAYHHVLRRKKTFGEK